MSAKHKSKKEKLFNLSCNVRLGLWIVTIVYFFLMNYFKFLPKVISAYLILFIGVFVLISDLYFKKTLWAAFVVTGKTEVIFWTIVHFLFALFFGFGLLKLYS